MKTVPLTQGLVAIVDDEDFDLVAQYHWHTYKRRGEPVYAVRQVRVGPKQWRGQPMHRLLLPDVAMVDHINGDGFDNRRANLRAATAALNQRNKRKDRTNGSGVPTSQFKGVTWNRNARKWLAQVSAGAVYRYLGLFTDEAEAARAYDAAARDLHGTFARLNFEVTS